MLINSPFAERTSARASTSSVSRADNCLYSKSCAVPPAMNHRFRQARLGFVFTSEIASTHRSPQPPLLNGITPAVKSLGGIRLPSQTKSYFILRLPSSRACIRGEASQSKIWLINLEDRALRKLCRGEKKYILFVSLRTCVARITTLEEQRFIRCGSPDAARLCVHT